MLKNIDFEKMSYEEGLALVAETRNNALQQGRVKQAGMLESLKKYWREMPEEAKWSIYGAGAGGLGGLAMSALTGEKKKKHYLRNLLTGGLLGGLAGYGGRLGYAGLKSDSPQDKDRQNKAIIAQISEEKKQALMNVLGFGTENFGVGAVGVGVGELLEREMARRQLTRKGGQGGFKSTNKDFYTHLNELVDDPLNKGTQIPKMKGGPELADWLQNATEAEVHQALKKGGFLHEALPKTLFSRTKDLIMGTGNLVRAPAIKKPLNALTRKLTGGRWPPSAVHKTPPTYEFQPKPPAWPASLPGSPPRPPSVSTAVPIASLENTSNWLLQNAEKSFFRGKFGPIKFLPSMLGVIAAGANMTTDVLDKPLLPLTGGQLRERSNEFFNQ